jgi:hypothetical protein
MPIQRSPGLGPSKKNWSVKDFKDTLKINNETYQELYSFLEDEMQRYELMFTRLRGTKSQLLLQHIYNSICTKFSEVFNKQLSEELGRKCITRLAQKCQYNYCRRQENQLPVKDNIRSQDALCTNTPQLCTSPRSPTTTLEPQQTLTIHDRRQRLDPPGSEYVYTLMDIMPHQMPTDKDTLKKNAELSTIQHILKDDLNFDPAADAIVLYKGKRLIRIVNNRTLRGALHQCGDGQLSVDIVPRSMLEF